LNTSKLTTFI